jgi:hypothetical protein
MNDLNYAKQALITNFCNYSGKWWFNGILSLPTFNREKTILIIHRTDVILRLYGKIIHLIKLTTQKKGESLIAFTLCISAILAQKLKLFN